MTTKPRSGWGFLQQAVASVESRLDNILGEDDDPPKKNNAPAQGKRPSTDLSRSSSTASAANDRLQERLARAMAKKNASRTESPTTVPQDAELENVAQKEEESSTPVEAGGAEETPVLASTDPDTRIPVLAADESDQDTSRETTDEQLSPLVADEALTASMHHVPRVTLQPENGTIRASTDATHDGEMISPRYSEDLKRISIDSQSRPGAEELLETQAEMNAYLERIDALRRNLQNLVDSVSDSAHKSAESAKQAAAAATPGSLAQKNSQKDEKIALLIEEGTRWSKTEMDLRGAIKKIRAQAISNNKEHESARVRAEKAERGMKAMEERARRAEASSKRAEQNLVAASAGASDLEAVKRERNALNATLSEMKAHLAKANLRAEKAEFKAQSEELEKERRRASDLQDEMTQIKIERELSEEKLQRRVKDLQAALDREKELARSMENEMLSEQASLESKLESFRVRAEEASSAETGHSQAKLLRQIETLQNQYAAASQNWQGIESSLMGRITNLEKERDEVVTREGDLRKKLRDTALRLKNAERDLDGTQDKYIEMDKSLADAVQEAQRSQKKASQLEEDLFQAIKDLETQKENAEREFQRKLDEEKSKWTANLQIPRTESPATSLRKSTGLGFDIHHLMSPVQYDRPPSRRSSVMPNTFDSNTPPRQQSTISFRGMANGSIPETPMSAEADEYFANVPATPLTTGHHSQRGGVNDLISTSTVGAGPSVQLVERMSANVRRLESEKDASKDELARLTTQRDEARQEVVSLMREAEEKRKVEERLKKLEKQHSDLSQRHQTTLEILGEKSEQVEELKADVLDVKQMYRQLADTMK